MSDEQDERSRDRGGGRGRLLDAPERGLGRRAARRRRARRARRDAPLGRARHGRGGPRPVPGHEARHRAGHRRRLLLRLRAAAPADAGRPRGDRGADGARASPPTTRSCAASCRRTRARAFFVERDQPFKVEILDDLAAKAKARRRRRCRRSTFYEHGPFIDLCRGPHVASHRQDRAVQAARGRRRVLARRREAADAPAHLRHGLGDAGGARRVPLAPRGGEEARPPPARRPARPVQLPRRLPGLGVLAPQGPDASGGRSRARCASSRRGAATRRSARRSSSASGSGSSRATGTSTATTCS